ncbi:MAG TPA: DUF72 domain-containing protein [Persephonella sp.]|nr:MULTISPECIES: DUF72 domain-containing protein [Persephonella]HCB69945.1 DUF72 domain-containing protein [Persephonella sp.]
MMFYIGCSGYFYWGWKGKFYPPEIKPSNWFDYYSDFFNTVEINSTFYNFPKEKNLKNWYRKAPENFIFSVKVHRSITHLKKFKDTKDTLDEFYSVVKNSLKEKLGAVLFQLPPSFRYSDENLRIIIDQLDPDFINVVEFREKSWWNDNVYDTLDNHNIIFCSVSAPGLPDDIIKTGNGIYIRFHGVDSWYRYDYSDDQLESWAKRILEIKADKNFIYFNNDFNAYAPKNALKLKELIDKYK